MNIRVKSLQGEEYIVTVQHDQSVSQLKAIVSEKANGLPIEKQKLVYKGRTMQDTNLIDDYNLEDGCKVHLILQKEGSLSEKEQQQQNQLLSSQSSSGNITCPMSISPSSNSSNQNNDHHYHKAKSSDREQSRFEMILREQLAQHFTLDTIEKIMTNLQHEINEDINSSSLDDLERLAKQKLNISNE